MDLTLSVEKRHALDNYPVLKDAVLKYINGDPGHDPRLLPQFIYWLRVKIEDEANSEPSSYTDWDDSWQFEFYSWGHNSRWSEVFTAWVNSNFEQAVDIALDLADSFGDNVL